MAKPRLDLCNEYSRALIGGRRSWMQWVGWSPW